SDGDRRPGMPPAPDRSRDRPASPTDLHVSPAAFWLGVLAIGLLTIGAFEVGYHLGKLRAAGRRPEPRPEAATSPTPPPTPTPQRTDALRPGVAGLRARPAPAARGHRQPRRTPRAGGGRPRCGRASARRGRPRRAPARGGDGRGSR